MKQISLFIIGLFYVLSIVACMHKAIDEVKPKAITVITSTCDTAEVKYSVQIKKVLQDNCLRCHGNAVYSTQGSGYNFDDFTVLQQEANNGHIAKAINHASGSIPMPIDKMAKISDCEIRQMMIWIDAGAPQN
jgi:uncharacterized membrane protein